MYSFEKIFIRDDGFLKTFAITRSIFGPYLIHLNISTATFFGHHVCGFFLWYHKIFTYTCTCKHAQNNIFKSVFMVLDLNKTLVKRNIYILTKKIEYNVLVQGSTLTFSQLSIWTIGRDIYLSEPLLV